MDFQGCFKIPKKSSEDRGDYFEAIDTDVGAPGFLYIFRLKFMF